MKYDVLKDAFGVSNNQDIVGLIEEREEEIRIAADVPQNKRQGQSEVDGQPKGQGQSEVDGQPKGQGQSEVDGQPKDSFLDSSPTDVEIAKMSSMIGSEWHQLGIYLGLTTAGLAQIRMNNQESADMIFKMLMKWRIKNPIDGTFRTLKSALKNAGSDWDTILTTLKRERTTDTTN